MSSSCHSTIAAPPEEGDLNSIRLEPMEMAPLALSAKVDAMSLTDQCLTSVTPTTKTTDSTTNTKVFRCTFPGCGREFQLKGNLKRHSNIHKGDKKFACKFCGKRFLRKADMEVHYRVHTGEKPYKCKYEECGKCFARRSDLLSHERTHTGRKPFACAFPGCDRRFARKFDLHKHQRLHEDQTDASGKSKTKKRKLSPCPVVPVATKRIDSGDESCDCPSDVATPLMASSDAALNPDVLLPEPPAMKIPVPIATTCLTSRRKMSATAACLDTPTRSMRYELKCPENHIHSPPACLAALSSLDAFLMSQESLPFSLDVFPPHCPSTSIGTSCCPAHLELRPPPPDDVTVSTGSKTMNGSDMLDQLLAPFPTTGSMNNTLAAREASISNPNMASVTAISGLLANSTLAGSVNSTTAMDQTFSETNLGFDVNESALSPSTLLPSSTADVASLSGDAALNAIIPSDQANSSVSTEASFNFAPVSTTSDLSTNSTDSIADVVPATVTSQTKPVAEKACLSTPTSSLLDYSRHNRSCGHLSIQHGNHRDYVVQNHLVCQDSITKLGARAEAKAAQPVKCTSPKDTHRPGCGHLPVRHKDHIDYVVEDNLICQQASWLEDDNLELLGDDFWDFYGAIDAFPTN